MPAPVCVLGLGLIGGSLLRAVRRAGREAWAYNRSADAVALAQADGFDVSTDLVAVVRRAAEQQALIVVAVPLPAVGAILQAVAEHAPRCALTDVVSVKQAVAAAVRAAGLDARYVGGHPMAGTAQSGWQAGDVDLFVGARWVVSVDEGRDPQVWSEVAELALDCGSVVVPAESGEHDDAVARISHLPHLLAEALALAGAGGGELALALAAGSFRDGTRVAGSDPQLVRAMCEGNAQALLPVLDECLRSLAAAREALAAGSVEQLAVAGHAARRDFEHRTTQAIGDITPGEPGWLEQLRSGGRAGLTLTR